MQIVAKSEIWHIGIIFSHSHRLIHHYRTAATTCNMLTVVLPLYFLIKVTGRRRKMKWSFFFVGSSAHKHFCTLWVSLDAKPFWGWWKPQLVGWCNAMYWLCKHPSVLVLGNVSRGGCVCRGGCRVRLGKALLLWQCNPAVGVLGFSPLLLRSAAGPVSLKGA